MTTQEIIDYYVNLLILQYRGKARARAHMSALVGEVVMDQLPLSVQNGYDVETAVGAQLDVLGKYVGVSRDTYDLDGPVTLDDDDFRILIKIKAIKNNSNSALSDIQSLLNIFFPDSLRVYDYANMHMSYLFDSDFGSTTLAGVFVRQGLLPKPMGVQLAALIFAPNIDEFYGFRTYDLPAVNNVGMNDYTNIITGDHWISYDDAITL